MAAAGGVLARGIYSRRRNKLRSKAAPFSSVSEIGKLQEKLNHNIPTNRKFNAAETKYWKDYFLDYYFFSF